MALDRSRLIRYYWLCFRFVYSICLCLDVALAGCRITGVSINSSLRCLAGVGWLGGGAGVIESILSFTFSLAVKTFITFKTLEIEISL